jgi:hypothetical protein
MPAPEGDMGSLLRFRDQIKKETMALRKANARIGGKSTFSLNPLSLKPVAPSIGTAPTDSYMTKEQLQRKAENITILRETLAKSNLAPRERYAVPMTASQEIGWHASRHTSMAKPLYLATHPKSDVAEFGEQYVVAMGCGPYDKTQINKRERSS